MPRSLINRILPLFALFVLAAAVSAQKPAKAVAEGAAESIAASPAFAEIVLKQAELESELEALLLDYTEEFPRVKEIRFSLSVLKRDRERLTAMPATDAAKLTLALGKLIVRRMELETDLWGLLQTYKEEHPDVRRARKRVEIYNRAVKDIMG